MGKPILHPEIYSSRTPADSPFAGGTLVCGCTTDPVKVKVTGDIAHNHACGCTKCWKPADATFSVVAVAPTANVEVIEHGEKLVVVDSSALIQRHACTYCGVHMYGPVERDHPFSGLSFIHPERFQEEGWPRPAFAAFVSSVIEGGFDPAEMSNVRAELRSHGLEPYDCLSPALMDYIATWTTEAAKSKGN